MLREQQQLAALRRRGRWASQLREAQLRRHHVEADPSRNGFAQCCGSPPTGGQLGERQEGAAQHAGRGAELHGAPTLAVAMPGGYGGGRAAQRPVVATAVEMGGGPQWLVQPLQLQLARVGQTPRRRGRAVQHAASALRRGGAADAEAEEGRPGLQVHHLWVPLQRRQQRPGLRPRQLRAAWHERGGPSGSCPASGVREAVAAAGAAEEPVQGACHPTPPMPRAAPRERPSAPASQGSGRRAGHERQLAVRATRSCLTTF